jgi:hypothetical protein
LGLGVLVGLPFPTIGSVGKTTAVLVGNKNRTVEVGSGVLVGVAVEVGVRVGDWVGGRDSAVRDWAATAVSAMVVSIAPGIGVATDETEKAGRSHATKIRIILRKRTNLRFTSLFFYNNRDAQLTELSLV